MGWVVSLVWCGGTRGSSVGDGELSVLSEVSIGRRAGNEVL